MFRMIFLVSLSKLRSNALSSSDSSPNTIRPRHRTMAMSSVRETSKCNDIADSGLLRAFASATPVPTLSISPTCFAVYSATNQCLWGFVSMVGCDWLPPVHDFSYPEVRCDTLPNLLTFSCCGFYFIGICPGGTSGLGASGDSQPGSECVFPDGVRTGSFHAGAGLEAGPRRSGLTTGDCRCGRRLGARIPFSRRGDIRSRSPKRGSPG